MERRLAAIVAADVVGYGRLMEMDEAGTLSALNLHREELIDPKIAEHHGRVVKVMGDGALVEFASAVDALECAAAIQRGMAERNAQVSEDRQITLRIGINLGDVIVEGDDIHGNGVIIATRLEGLADPGGICVARNVFNQVKKKVDLGFENLGKHRVKNISEPLMVYRVLLDPAHAGKVVAAGVGSVAGSRIPIVVGTAAVVTALVIGGLWSWRDDPSLTENTVQITSADTRRIAILPFANMSAEGTEEYFADGLTEELITRLSKIGDLRVIARTSVMKYKGDDRGIAEIGRELKVGTILEGSVRKVGDRVKINAQLIDVASEEHLWVEDYDRDFKDIFAIQSAIADEVAASLQITLLAPERQRIESPDTDSIEAYELYLEANHLQRHASAENFPKAIELLRKAVEVDPEYAAAYAALADLLPLLTWYLDVSPEEVNPEARKFAEKALALDGALARAHVALARIKVYADWDWDGAEASYKRAIDLNPSFARARTSYGHNLLMAVRRRDDEALAQIERAVELDPFASRTLDAMGWLRHHRREYDQSIAVFRKMQELYPDEPWSSVGIGQGLVFKGLYDEGIDEIKKAIEVSPDSDLLRGFLAWAYGMSNRLKEAREVVGELKVAAEHKHVSPMAFAWAYTGMADKKNAIAAFEKAYEERDGAIIYIRVPEFYDVLASEPRYRALLQKMGLAS